MTPRAAAADFETMTRPCVHAVAPYFPGKPVAEVQRELGLKKVAKLASNENFLGASPKALAELRRGAADAHLYPESASPLLREAFARMHGLSPAQVVVGNGSDDVLRMLCEALLSPEDEVVVSQHAFIRFKQHSALMGAKVIEVPMTDWTHDLETMARAASTRTKLMFVASPNNPTGTCNTHEELRTLLRRLPSSTVLVLDEAYGHYAEPAGDYHRTLPELLRRHSNLFVVRTFSKAYGLAGLRVGLGAGDPELVSWLDRVRLPFNVSTLAQRAALAALSDGAFLRRSVAACLREREAYAADLRRLGCTVHDSSANFLFVETPIPGREFFHRLLREGVIVRPLDEYGLPGHVRVSVGGPAERRLLREAAARALDREELR